MALYDGEKKPVSTILGREYRATFISRYTVPLFGSRAVGFALAEPTEVSGRVTLNTAILQPAEEVPVLTSENESEFEGFYSLRYFLEPRIAVFPDAYRRFVYGEGPVPISNMWDKPKIHFSSL